MRIVTWNIRYATTSPFQGEVPWSERSAGLLAQARFLTRYPADTFLVAQEVLHNQLTDIMAGLNEASEADTSTSATATATASAQSDDEWAYIGVGRDDGKQAGEYAPIFYRPASWELLEWKTVWLSETPDKPSRGWDGASTRILTFGLFRSRKSNPDVTPGKVVLAMTTHLDDQGSTARREGAKLILKTIADYRASGKYGSEIAAFFLAGDFNSRDDQEAYQVFSSDDSSLVDAHNLLPAQRRHGDEITWTGFGHENEDSKRIDFAFLGPKAGLPWKILDYACLPCKFDNGVYLSDHRPVVVDAELQ
ncbi:hypothetical protein KEM52_004155 [Ascosphaera acerosa]|nr:hypothetical protein KEM52_004155 [Ascosphaera acerosa]